MTVGSQKVIDTAPKTMARFWEKVDRKGDIQKCWEWQAARTKFGHGLFGIKQDDGNWKMMLAHRVIFFWHYGFFPEVVRHRCDNPCCVNPHHLESGSQADNARDMHRRGRARLVGRPPKVSDDEVATIRDLHESGWYSQEELARVYGISPGYVSLLVRGLARPQS